MRYNIDFSVKDTATARANMQSICNMIRNSKYVEFGCSISHFDKEFSSSYRAYAKPVSVIDPVFNFFSGFKPGVITLEFPDGKTVRVQLEYKDSTWTTISGAKAGEVRIFFKMVEDINLYCKYFYPLNGRIFDRSSADHIYYGIEPLNDVEAMQRMQEFNKLMNAEKERIKREMEKQRQAEERIAKEKAAKRAAEEAAARQASSMSATDFENLFRGNQTKNSTSSNTQNNAKSSVDATVDALAKSMGPDVFAAMFGGKKPQGK